MSAVELTPHRVKAFNVATQSENKIHDDTVAKQYGFTGGLVPGVDVYGYMTHMPVQHWGRAWLERGSAECRFNKPVYDGEIAIVSAVGSGDGIDISVESQGELCATGHAALPAGAPALPALKTFPAVMPGATRKPADESSLAPGTALGINAWRVTDDIAARYLTDLRETETLYAREKLVHPGSILRACNWALTHNVVLGPWIHVGSKVQNYSAAKVGDELSMRARVTGNFERKGHRFVELDGLVLANGRTPVARVTHTAIYQLRNSAAA